MKNLINSDGSINTHSEFTFTEGKNKGKRLRVVGTKSDGFKAIDCIDSIKNIKTGKIIDIKRRLLLVLSPIIQQTVSKN